MTDEQLRLKKIRRLIEMNVPETFIESQFVSYLKSQHGGIGIKLIFWVTSKILYDWLKQKAFSMSYFWNVIIRKQNDRAFFANRIGMTEAEIASMEQEGSIRGSY